MAYFMAYCMAYFFESKPWLTFEKVSHKSKPYLKVSHGLLFPWLTFMAYFHPAVEELGRKQLVTRFTSLPVGSIEYPVAVEVATVLCSSAVGWIGRRRLCIHVVPPSPPGIGSNEYSSTSRMRVRCIAACL